MQLAHANATSVNGTKYFRKQEKEKKRAYEEQIREVEHGSFSPLVFTTAGGMGATGTK